MFDNMKNMASFLGQAKQMKEKMEQLQTELGDKTVEADAGAGAVRVVANGKLEIISVHLDKPLLATLAGEGADADQQMIEDLITGATNAALDKARELVQQEMAQVTGGLDLPGLEKMMGS
jgi:DNA-binding YbaB/EbfC family protein